MFIPNDALYFIDLVLTIWIFLDRATCVGGRTEKRERPVCRRDQLCYRVILTSTVVLSDILRFRII